MCEQWRGPAAVFRVILIIIIINRHRNSSRITESDPFTYGTVLNRILTCIMVTVGSILGGSGMWIWYLFLSTLEDEKKQDGVFLQQTAE